MDEQHFLNLLFDKFNLSDFAIEVNTPKFKNGLIGSIDYYRLWEYIDKEYKHKSMPDARELNCIAKNHHFLLIKCPALQYIEALKRIPKPDFDKQDDEFKRSIRDKLNKIGIKSKIEAFQ